MNQKFVVRIIEYQSGNQVSVQDARKDIEEYLNLGYEIEGFGGTYRGAGRGGVFSTLMVKRKNPLPHRRMNDEA